MRAARLKLILQVLAGREINLIIDETGDRKKGHHTDYVKRQYIGNLGKVENEIVVVAAYGFIEGISQAFKDEAATGSIQLNSRLLDAEFKQHPYWESGTNWKSAFNNLRLIIQPYIFWHLIEPWLRVFPIPGIKRGFFKLIEIMNGFRAPPMEYAVAS